MADAICIGIFSAAAFFAFIDPIYHSYHRADRKSEIFGTLLLAFTSFAGFYAGYMNAIAAGIVLLVLFIIRVLIVHFLTEEGWRESVCVCICAGMIIGLADELGVWLCSIPGPDLFSPGAMGIVWRMAVMIVLVPLVYRFFASTMPRDGHYEIGPRQISLALVEYILFILMKMIIANRTLHRTDDGQFVMMALLFCQLLLIVILYLEYIMFRSSAMQKEMQVLNFLWNEQKAQYMLARENIDLINRKCHDLKHQIRALRGESGRYCCVRSPDYSGNHRHFREGQTGVLRNRRREG